MDDPIDIITTLISLSNGRVRYGPNVFDPSHPHCLKVGSQDEKINVILFLDDKTWEDLCATVRAAQVPEQVEERGEP